MRRISFWSRGCRQTRTVLSIWSPKRKYLALSCALLYTWFNGMALSGVYSVLVPLSEALSVTEADLNAGTGYVTTAELLVTLYRDVFSSTYISCMIGVKVASVFTGVFSDHFTIQPARRSNGILEAEHRLCLSAVSTLVIPSSVILWGVGTAHQIYWFRLGLYSENIEKRNLSCQGSDFTLRLFKEHGTVEDPEPLFVLSRNNTAFTLFTLQTI
ncbi:hypothetical protein DL766_007489 [Monosporascus sp. MC13-8B]|uniref:Autophagy-related protein n=1 Tax=Monosporascus cannonballus TaxID=155416 RepID=A0ABY0GWP1_9PEZI|nr:hypothetical protein DL762_008652 [Monosporascus cannonballus]RYO82897.1 hypothetical protein DL763_008072 [Monosporascus cannonballus]RYP23606.1 hypothetical protein DL766_007489 [Monosporascus sp. MC13-8B]